MEMCLNHLPSEQDDFFKYKDLLKKSLLFPSPLTGKNFEDIYVQVMIKEKEEKPRQEEKQQKESPLPELPLDVFQKKGNFAIIGSPGSGKTTILKHLALELVNLDYLPIFIRLYDLQTFENIPGLENYMTEEMKSGKSLKYISYYLKFKNKNLADIIESGKIILLLDGFDEVVKNSEEVKRWIDNLSHEFKIIITSREAGFDKGLLGGIVTHTLEFDEPKQKELISKLVENKEKQKEIEAFFKQKKIFNQLTNPLFITLICAIWNEETKNIQTNTELMRQFINHVDERCKQKTIDQKKLYPLTRQIIENEELFFPDIREFLSSAAFMMHCINKPLNYEVLKEWGKRKEKWEKYLEKEKINIKIPYSKVEKYIYNKITSETTINGILQEISRTGLLIPVRQNEYEFLHRSFQEYFAAEYIVNNMDLDTIKWFIRTKVPYSEASASWGYLKEEIIHLTVDSQKITTEIYPMMYLHDPNWEEVLKYITGLLDEDYAQNLVESIIEGELNLECEELRQIDDCLKNDIFLGLNMACELKWKKIFKEVCNDKVTDAFLVALKNPSGYAQWSVVKAFGGICKGDDNIIDVLLKSLKDSDSNVRLHAADALGEIGKGDDKVINALLHTLKDSDRYVQLWTAKALGKIGNGDDKVIDDLLHTLKDSDRYDVRMHLANALGEIGKGDDKVIDALLHTLKDSDSDVKSSAADALGKIGKGDDKVIDSLLHTLKDSDSDVKSSAADALGKIGKGDDKVIDALLQAFKDSDRYDVQMHLAKSLGEIGKGNNNLIDALLHDFKDSYSDVRWMASNALGEIGKGDDKVIDALLHTLKDSDSDVKRIVSDALGKIGKGDDKVINALLQAFKDSDRYDVQMSATWALGEIGKGDDKIIDSFLHALKDSHRYVRMHLADALGKIGKGDDKVIDALLAALKDSDSLVRWIAADALGKIGKGDDKIIDALLDTLKDSDSLARSSAADALGKIGKGDDKVIDAFLDTLKDSDSLARSRAADALGNIGKGDDKVIDALLIAIKDSDSNTRSRAADALGNIGKGDDKIIDALLIAIKDSDSNTRSRAADALVKLGTLNSILEFDLLNINNEKKFYIIPSIWERERKNNKEFIISYCKWEKKPVSFFDFELTSVCQQAILLSASVKKGIFDDPFSAYFQNFSPYYNFLQFKQNLYDNWFFTATRAFVPHDKPHSERVYKNMALILTSILANKPERLTKDELLSLMYAAYLHDVGMTGGDLSMKDVETSKKTKISITDYKFTRKFHGLISYEKIKNNPNNYQIGSSSRETPVVIGEICKYHQRLRTLEELQGKDEQKQKEKEVYIGNKKYIIEIPPPGTIPAKLFSDKAEIVRIPLLSAILRVCDAMDICRSRVWADKTEDFFRHSAEFILKEIATNQKNINWENFKKLENFTLQIENKLIQMQNIGIQAIDTEYRDWINDAKQFLEDNQITIINSIGADKFQDLEYIFYLYEQPKHFKKHDTFENVTPVVDLANETLTLKYSIALGSDDEEMNKLVEEDLNGEWQQVKKFWEESLGISTLKVEFMEKGI